MDAAQAVQEQDAASPHEVLQAGSHFIVPTGDAFVDDGEELVQLALGSVIR